MSDAVLGAASLYARLRSETERIVIGQNALLEMLFVALLCRGHVLLEGVPGTAKTLMAKTVARLIDARFRRIQFTPDLMPSDIVGTNVFDLQSGRFYVREGPVFTQVLLADEINRAPAKTQAALLEAMEEHQVTIEGERRDLAFPFFVVATQNPIEYEGTYPLPEAQLDRFFFKLLVSYPDVRDERELLRRYDQGFDAHELDAMQLQPLLGPEALRSAMREVDTVTVDDAILAYITQLVGATRESAELSFGASPRASIALLRGAKALSALHGQDFVGPDEVKAVAMPVLRHRLLLRPEVEIEGTTADRVIQRILDRVPVPR